MSRATGVLGTNSAKNQMFSTGEDIAAAIRRELTSALDVCVLKVLKRFRLLQYIYLKRLSQREDIS